MYQDKSEKEDEGKQPLGISDDLMEYAKDEPPNLELSDQEPIIEEIEDKEAETEELIESDKVRVKAVKRRCSKKLEVKLEVPPRYKIQSFSLYCRTTHRWSVAKDHVEENQIKNNKTILKKF